MSIEYTKMMGERRKKIMALAQSYKTDYKEKWWFTTQGYNFKGGGLFLVSKENELTALIFDLWLELRDNFSGPLFHLSKVFIGRYTTDRIGYMANFNHCWEAI